MDDICGKRPVDKLSLTKRSSHAIRETSSFSGHSPQPCNRLGCSGRLNIMKGGQGGGTGCSHKAKSVRSSVCLSVGKEVTGSSSKNGSSVSARRNPKKEAQKKIALLLDTDSSETSSVRDELEGPEVVPPPEKIPKGVEELSKKGVTVMEVGSSSSGPALVSGSRTSSNIKNSPSKVKSLKQQPTNPNMGRCGLRNLKCNSTADAIPSSSRPPQNQSLSKRKDLSKGQTSEGETSTSRGKKTNETLSSSRNGVSIPESRTETGGIPELDRNVASVRVRRSSRSTSERNTRSSSSNESRFRHSRLARRDLPVDGNASGSNSSYELSDESLFRHFSISNRPANGSRLSPGAGSSSPDSLGISSRSLINWESFQQYTMDGIAEVDNPF